MKRMTAVLGVIGTLPLAVCGSADGADATAEPDTVVLLQEPEEEVSVGSSEITGLPSPERPTSTNGDRLVEPAGRKGRG